MTPRCINIDWLEVFCFEPSTEQPCDPNYFMSQGYVVDVREYGTRIYNQMFTILQDGEPWIEVRRSPKNPLMHPSACHLRLHNRTCYLDDAADIMQRFITVHRYLFQRVSRIDLCLDFVRFDDNTIPRVFMQRYMRGKFSKLNQSTIHSHGSDAWTGRVWNSVSWGSPSSMISTKFYNKTLELYDPKTNSYGKPYIRYAWLNNGLIDDLDRCTLKGETQEIWRVEFSIRSSVKRWFVIELDGKSKAYQSIHNTLDCYDTKPKQLCIFASLANHYFHFKRYQIGQRKDRCQDRVLFKWNELQQFVEVDRTTLPSSKTPSPLLLQLIRKLRLYSQTLTYGDLYQTVLRLLQLLEQIQLKQEQNNPWSQQQTLAIQQLISRRQAGDTDATLTALMSEIADLLHINSKTMIF